MERATNAPPPVRAAHAERPPAARGREPSHTLAVFALEAAPFVAILLVLAPYVWPLDHGPASGFSDLHHYHAPMAELFAEGLQRDGELPRWNVQDFGGMPTIGDPQTEMYNPIQWLVLARPSLHAFGLLIVAYTLAGAAGFLLYARVLGLPPSAAAAGAVTLTLGGKLLLHLVLPGHMVFAPFFLVPLLLWTVQRLVCRPGPGPLATAGALIGLLAVSLHPQLLFYTGCLLVPIAAVAIRHAPRPARALAAVLLATTLGAGLAAVHLVPVTAFANEFSRGQAAFFEAGRASEDTGPGKGWFADTISGASAAAGAIDWEAHYFLGGVALALASVGLVVWPRGHPRRGLAWLHGVLALAFTLFGLGAAGGLEPVLRELPGFALFRIPARALVLVGLPIAVLVALGMEALGDPTLARRRRLAVVAGALAFGLLVVTGAGRAHFAALALAAAGALLVERGALFTRGEMLSARSALTWLGGTLVVTALALDAALVVMPSVRTAPAAEIGRPAPGLVLPPDLAEATRIAELQRGVVDPGIPELTVRRRGLETLAGFNPLIPWRFVLYASYAGGFDPFGDGFDVAVPLLARRAPALFDLLGVSHVLHPPSRARTAWQWERTATAFPRAYLVPGPIVVPEGRGETLVPRELDALARLTEIDPRAHVLLHGTAAETALAAAGAGSNTTFAAFRPLTIARRSANHITLDVRLDELGILVFNEPFFPGWRARADGREIPVLRANVLFRALVLAAGGHHVELEFAPLAWRVGWWISLASTAALAVLGLVAWRGAPGTGSLKKAGYRLPERY